MNLLKIIFYHFVRLVVRSKVTIITWHVVLHTVTELLREIRFAFQNAVPLCVRTIITQFSFFREEALPLLQRYGNYRRVGRRYPRSYDHSAFLARCNCEREIGDFRCLHGIVEQHLQYYNHIVVVLSGNDIIVRRISIKSIKRIHILNFNKKDKKKEKDLYINS